MRQRGYGRRDANEKDIVEALRQIGARVERCTGPDLPDLLVGFRGRWIPMEVKTTSGGMSPRQQDALVQGKVPYPIVRSVDEAIRLITEMKR